MPCNRAAEPRVNKSDACADNAVVQNCWTDRYRTVCSVRLCHNRILLPCHHPPEPAVPVFHLLFQAVLGLCCLYCAADYMSMHVRALQQK